MDGNAAPDPNGGGGGGSGQASVQGRGRGSIRPPDQHQELRRPHQPHHAEGAQNAESAKSPPSEMVKKSVLSAEAAEFVPKAHTAPLVVSSSGSSAIQERIQIARQNQDPVQHVVLQRQQQQYAWHQPVAPYQHIQQQYGNIGYQAVPYQHYPVIQDYNQPDNGDQSSDIGSCLMHIDSAMKTLTMNPGRFDSLVASLVDSVNPFLDQPDACEQIFSSIIQQSVNEGNFRYSGARLCTHLDTVALLTDNSTSVFRQTLIKKCTEKTEEQAETWRQITKHTMEDEKKCHGLIFFLAELVTQMESRLASDLGKLLIRLINTVLKNPATTSVKNICQVLKLAGQTLERGNRNEMEQVMRKLSELVIQDKVDPHVSRMVSNVSELRSGNWGVPSHAPVHTGNKPPVGSQSSQSSQSSQGADGPIFYGPDGKVITEEESQFLEDLAECDLTTTQEAWANDEEDDMIAEAFEEFLKYSHDKNKTNKNNVQSRKSKER